MKLINRDLYAQRKGAIWLLAGVLIWALILLWVRLSFLPDLMEFYRWFWTRRYAGCITDALLCCSWHWWVVPTAIGALLALVANVPGSGPPQRVVVATAISVAAIACLLMTYALVAGTQMALRIAMEDITRSESARRGLTQ